MLKKIFRFILYAGAVVCALAGWCATYILVTESKENHSGGWLYELLVLLIYVCLSFTPGVMFLTGLRTKMWHWVFTTVVEAIVLAPALCELIALIALLEGKIAI